VLELHSITAISKYLNIGHTAYIEELFVDSACRLVAVIVSDSISELPDRIDNDGSDNVVVV
jgi:hypothetical protein